jgi:hypothetical protein
LPSKSSSANNTEMSFQSKPSSAARRSVGGVLVNNSLSSLTSTTNQITNVSKFMSSKQQ